MRVALFTVVFVIIFVPVFAQTPSEYVKDLPSQFTSINVGQVDLWRVDYPAAQKVDVKIYSRWGKLVFSGANNSGWDGRDLKGNQCTQGVYIYVIKITLNGVEEAFKGTVELIK